MVRDPSAHGGGGAKVFRGPTPVLGAQDRGSNAGALVRRVVGWLRRQRQPPVMAGVTPEDLVKVLGKVIERHFGREVWMQVMQYIRTRCEEDGCDKDFENICLYCGMRLCKTHTVDCYGVAYCRLHVNPKCRLADVFIVRREDL
jgi:hypothetical protein